MTPEFSTDFQPKRAPAKFISESVEMFRLPPKPALVAAMVFAICSASWLVSAKANGQTLASSDWLVPVQAPAFLVAEYQAPMTKYSAGHRGVDFNVQDKQVIYAPTNGVIAFSGSVAKKPVMTLDHGAGLKASFEPACGRIPQGTWVIAGEPIGVVCGNVAYRSHCQPWLCLHFSVRRDARYLSPRVFIGGLSRAKLRY